MVADMVADMEVDKVADMVADKAANTKKQDFFLPDTEISKPKPIFAFQKSLGYALFCNFLSVIEILLMTVFREHSVYCTI